MPAPLPRSTGTCTSRASGRTTARRTAGVASEPAPQVFQTALSDFYIEYQLVCQASQTNARNRAEAIAALNANVIDTFNEYGVQIMSPHYVSDPSRPKVVAREQWNAAPAGAEKGVGPHRQSA